MRFIHQGPGDVALDAWQADVEARPQEVAAMPELLRLKGSLLVSKPQPRVAAAEVCFAQSLELSRYQGARAWQLRTATDLATLYAGQGQAERGQAVLRPVFEAFAKGFETADLRAAKSLLSALDAAQFP